MTTGRIYAIPDPHLDLTARISRALLEHERHHPGQPPPTQCAVNKSCLPPGYAHPTGIKVLPVGYLLLCDVWLLEKP